MFGWHVFAAWAAGEGAQFVQSLCRLQKEKTSKMGELQQKALSRVEDKVNLNKMNIKEFRKGQLRGCTEVLKV